MILPPWLDSEAWAEWVDMRRRIKKPLTDRAMIRAIGRLGDIRDAGYDPNASLIQSADFYWQDLYPPKEKQIEAAPGASMKRSANEALENLDRAKREATKPPERILKMVGKA